MDVKIIPEKLSGSLDAVSSKSDAHRTIIASALCDTSTDIYINNISEDISATLRCVKAFGGDYKINDGFITVYPFKKTSFATADCGESGTTARFILPVAACFCENFTLYGSGRLPKRPFTELVREMRNAGCEITSEHLPITCKGTLDTKKEFFLEGNVSSQYISGLLFAIAAKGNEGKITLTSQLESEGYVDMTVKTLEKFGITVVKGQGFYKVCEGKLKSPGKVFVEGDWSSAAFWYVAEFLGSNIKLSGLDKTSLQRDSKIASYLPLPDEVDAKDIPDIVPILCVAAAGMNKTTKFINTKRLKIKESDRAKTTCELINDLGGCAVYDDNTITILGKGFLKGGEVNSYNDHRIAMSAAVASTICDSEVIIKDAYCVKKSYPSFYEHFKKLGGNIADV
ncbi:MAG: 3-phosphoshikimate 1-carboxyvinyltransferase [Clostridia bacterium]|nr:3-phosphoshikimate 1-carboxyvinyltransferase [Clostridia bacterium]